MITTEHIQLASNDIYVIPTKKFKTTTIVFKFVAPLDSNTITSRSILSKLMTRVTNKYRTDKEMNNVLAELYGAHLYSYVNKQANNHIMTIGIEIVNEKYLQSETPILEQAIQLLHEVIFNPYIIEDEFNEKFTNQEKSLLKKKLTAMEDNKSQRAYLQFMNHMFEEEPYKYLAAGRLEDIDDINATSLVDTYHDLIHQNAISTYIIGNVELNNIKELCEQYFSFKHNSNLEIETSTFKEIEHVKEIVDYTEIDQAKLNMGYRFPITFHSKEYYSFLVLNMLLGGDASSILFSEVREKQSLAYSIHSQIDPRNGFLYIVGGISKDKVQVAKETILNIYQDLKEGNFEESKLQLAKKVLVSNGREMFDKQRQMIDLLHTHARYHSSYDHEEWIKEVEAITVEDIKNIAHLGQLDTIYILTEGEKHE
ncbi:EF-P 5-aminopentanol modification-associated protein YfmF [Mammaliicoccus stepanovicii]|uniref:Zinc protease n=1 Tax=Mammaliicoccus stepanovicii TaxID=643214 RepID=A0A239ZFV5_9STAP|nr:pitrilysin family protein [Mammaliicoccus stepanovicii]PNZ79032.1 insulinase family protein [Mammaliicoccus stepanovicii]GGI41856.1 peptidase M16 [Mammaliicoccus stepanovicii]SNV70161.1 zinc protease [Mammaliicoccus stepanovicii]